ncbi:methionyl-tRNA formyltransferase, partial [Streptococcus suis]
VEAEGEGPVCRDIARSKKELIIAKGQGALSLKTVQTAGKPKMTIADFLKGAGRDIAVGDQIGDQ